MGLATHIAGRSLRVRPGRTFLSVLGIALGVAIACGVLVLDYNTVEGTRRRKANDAMPDLMLRAPEGSGSVERLRELEGVSLAIEGFQETAQAGSMGDLRGSERGLGIRLLAYEAEHFSSFGLAHIESGRGLTGESAFEVLIGGALAEKLGAGLGDEIWLARPPRLSRKVCKDGELVEVDQGVLDEPTRQPFNVVGILARTGVGRTASGQVAIVDFEEGRQLFDGKKIRSTFWAKRAAGTDAEALEASLAQVYALEVNRGTVIGQAADERAFRTGVRVAGLFALVLGLFVIFHTLSMSLTERVTEVGTLHALGATRGQIARVFFSEAVLQALAGGILGIAMGLGLAKGLLVLGLTTLGSGKHIELFLVPWPTVLGLASVGVVAALCGSVYPLMLLGGADPGAALRGDREISAHRRQHGFAIFYGALIALLLPAVYFILVPSVGATGDRMVQVILGAVGVLVGVVALALVAPRIIAAWASMLVKPLVALFPFSARLAQSGMLRSPGRIGASASAIALVAAGFVGLKGLTDSLRGEIDDWSSRALIGKVWVRNLPTAPFEELSAHLMQDPAVLGVEMGDAQINSPFLIQGMDMESVSGYGSLSLDPDLKAKMAKRHGMIITPRLAQNGGYELGDKIHLEKSDGSVQPFEIMAIDDAYGHWNSPDERMYGLVDKAYLERYFCVDPETVSRIAIKFDGPENPGVARALLDEYFGSESGEQPEPWVLETGSARQSFYRFDLERDFQLFDLLVLLSAGLAALGVLNGQLLATLERAKEFGITKALGASRGQVAGLIWVEALALSLVGGILGTAVGLALVPPVVAAVESLSGLNLPPVFRPVVILQGLGGAILVGLLASVYPIYRLGRMDTLRAVRTG